MHQQQRLLYPDGNSNQNHNLSEILTIFSASYSTLSGQRDTSDSYDHLIPQISNHTNSVARTLKQRLQLPAPNHESDNSSHALYVVSTHKRLLVDFASIH